MEFGRLWGLVLLVLVACPAWAQVGKRLPILDVHLHASAPDGQGPPPMAMCAPLAAMPVWDPA